MAQKPGKESRIQKRAKYEINIVKNKIGAIQQYVDDLEKNIRDINRDLVSLDERGLLTSDSNEIDKIAIQIVGLNNDLKTYNEFHGLGIATLKQFNTLMSNLKLLYQQKKFRYIVRKIPAHKIDLMSISDPKDLELILNLIVKINDHMRSTIERIRALTNNADATNESKISDHETKMEVLGKSSAAEQKIKDSFAIRRASNSQISNSDQNNSLNNNQNKA